jgi:hypothetical protein
MFARATWSIEASRTSTVSETSNAEHSVAEALAFQAAACGALGSALYARLIGGLHADLLAGGTTAELLEGRSTRPIHDMVVLRLLGAVHAIVLDGRAPALASRYASVGGVDDGSDPTADFLAVVRAFRSEVEQGLTRPVQTNEVARAAALTPAFVLLARRHGLPLRLLEIGASAGLLLRWDGYRYEHGDASLGPATSPLVFRDVWEGDPPLSGSVEVAGRRGCDIAPLDATTAAGERTLLSFVWPDQVDRIARLRAALTVARAWPVPIDAGDAARWLARVLPARPPAGATTVVYHSIVWQYLPPESAAGVRAALVTAGARATPEAPLAWLRMEPAGPTADLRLTTWPGGAEEVLGLVGYHGRPVQWDEPAPGRR